MHVQERIDRSCEEAVRGESLVCGSRETSDNTVTISAGFYLMACNLGAKR